MSRPDAPWHRATVRDLIAEHGPAGGLLLRLRRFALLGWILFLITAGVFALHVLASAVAPVPVIAVDQEGRVLGTFEYLDASQRTDEELVAAATRFLQDYLSVDSQTVFDDLARAFSVMEPALYQRTLAAYQSSDLPNRIASSGARSYLTFDQVELVERQGDRATVRARGQVHIVAEGVEQRRSFDQTVILRSVARTLLGPLGTLGVRVVDVQGG